MHTQWPIPPKLPQLPLSLHWQRCRDPPEVGPARPGPGPAASTTFFFFFFCQTITTLRLAQTQDSLKHTHTRPTGGVPLTQCVSQSFFFVFLLLTLCRHPWPVRQHHAISADFAQHVSVHARFTGKLKKIHSKLYQHINIV